MASTKKDSYEERPYLKKNPWNKHFPFRHFPKIQQAWERKIFLGGSFRTLSDHIDSLILQEQAFAEKKEWKKAGAVRTLQSMVQECVQAHNIFEEALEDARFKRNYDDAEWLDGQLNLIKKVYPGVTYLQKTDPSSKNPPATNPEMIHVEHSVPLEFIDPMKSPMAVAEPVLENVSETDPSRLSVTTAVPLNSKANENKSNKIDSKKDEAKEAPKVSIAMTKYWLGKLASTVSRLLRKDDTNSSRAIAKLLGPPFAKNEIDEDFLCLSLSIMLGVLNFLFLLMIPRPRMTNGECAGVWFLIFFICPALCLGLSGTTRARLQFMISFFTIVVQFFLLSNIYET